MPVCFQWSASGLPVAFQWSSSVFQLCKLTLDRHWNTTGCYHQPVWFQWHPSVLAAPVVFQCVPIMQINTGLPLEHHWVLASASVVPVASQCTCGSSGLPVWSAQWYPSVLTESGLEVISSGHFPACDPLCIQLVWWELFELNWFHLTCHPKYTKTMMMLISKACTEWCWSTHMCQEQNWHPLKSSKLQVMTEYTETCPLAYWCPAILLFQTGLDATLHA